MVAELCLYGCSHNSQVHVGSSTLSIHHCPPSIIEHRVQSFQLHAFVQSQFSKTATLTKMYTQQQRIVICNTIFHEKLFALVTFYLAL
ncbi:hypothetical protein VNO80_09816 [Phaseolus coccineus]|uniref:Uncharacterized protein n=1 Tax=Phaseolus coccineus TaxID=3886 RepID=A0AAN9NC84_PHACN